MAWAVYLGFFSVLFSNRFFQFIFYKNQKTRHYVIVYCHRPKLDLNSQNMTLIKLNYTTLNKNYTLSVKSVRTEEV
jgi:hypothetical protein